MSLVVGFGTYYKIRKDNNKRRLNELCNDVIDKLDSIRLSINGLEKGVSSS